MFYSIRDFDKNGIITFNNTKNITLYSIDVIKEYNDYRPPTKFHYYNKELNEVIVCNFESVVFRPFYTGPLEITSNDRVYKKCTQYEFDNWHNKEFPNTHNAIVFRILREKMEL